VNIYKDHINILKQFPCTGQDFNFNDFLNQAKEFQNQVPGLNELVGSFKGISDSSLGAGRGVGELYSISNDLFETFQKLQKESGYLEQRYNRLNRVFGISSVQAGKFGQQIDKIGVSLEIGGGYALEYVTQLSKIAPNMVKALASENKFTKGLLRTQDVLIANLGLSEQQALSFQRFAATQADSTDEYLAQQYQIAEAIESSTGLTGVFRDITSEISSLGADTRQQFGRIPGSLEIAVLKAKQLGTSFDAIQKTGRKLLNVEETVSAELEYQLLSGQRLVKNGKSLTAEYQKAFLSGDADKMAQAQFDIVESQRDVIKNNVLARESLAKYMGISSDALVQQAEQLDTIDKLSAQGIDIDLSARDVDQQIAKAIADAPDKNAQDLLKELTQQRKGTQSTEQYLDQLVDLATSKGLLTNISNLSSLGGAEDIIRQQQEAFTGLIGPTGDASTMINKIIGDVPGVIQKGVGIYFNVVDAVQDVNTFGQALVKIIPFVNALDEVFDIVLDLIPGGFDIVQGGQTLKKLYKDMLPDATAVGTYKRAEEAGGITISANKLEVGEIQTRAAGGPVAAGTPYIIGEVGPELFVPSTNGTIVPNNQMGQSGNVTVNIDYNQLAAAMSNIRLTVESAPEGINMS